MALSHAKLYSLLAPWALDSLEGADAGLIKRHLSSGCPSCEAELARLRAAASLLNLAPLALAPPNALKTRLLEAIARPDLELTRSLGHVRLSEGRVQTGTLAQAELRVRGAVLVALMQNSVATLRRGARGLEMLLEKGSAMVQVNPGTAFFTHMPLGSVEVKGTYFFVESRGPKNSYFCLCEGWVALSAPGLKTELKTEDHQAFELQLSNGLTLMHPTSTEHSEPDLGPLD
jgi:ferric-dicitrate binding protein FerR (iron transport regulator)